MPVLDEASYLTKRAGSMQKTTSGDVKLTASGDSKTTSSIKVPNGVAKPPAAVAMPNLIDFSIDDIPVAPTSATTSEPPDFIKDLIDIDLGSSPSSGYTLPFLVLLILMYFCFIKKSFCLLILSIFFIIHFLVCLGGEPAPALSRNILDDLLSIGTSSVENGPLASSSFPTSIKS
jgi:hypothetical protein